LVPTVAFSEVDEKIALFELGAYDDPRGAEHVEEEPISRQARGGPDEQEHEQVEGMADVAIGTVGHESKRRWGGTAQVCLEREGTERVKPPK